VIVAKGKKLDEWKPAGRPSPATIDAMVGSTGNLRAPCLRAGKIVVVGFNEDAYTEVLL
jgi:arsenate reductase-like glutaredoxin family protein